VLQGHQLNLRKHCSRSGIYNDFNEGSLKVFSIPFNFTCFILFYYFGLLKLLTCMVFFSKSKISKQKKPKSFLFIYQE